MKKLTIAAKAFAVVAIWLATLALLGILVSSDDWFWYHYIGTMPIDTYRFLSATIGVSAFFGSILLVVVAGVGTVGICGGFKKADPDQKPAA